MRATRYRLLLSSTAHTHLVSVTLIIVSDQTQAELVATNKLRFLRLTRNEGQAWDRWDLGVKASRDGGWFHVARGDHTGTQWRSSDTATPGVGRGAQ